MEATKTLGQVAYEAYGKHWIITLPWEELSDRVKQIWQATAEAVKNVLNGTD